MSDSYTEVTHEGYLSRIGGAIKGILVGGILFLLSFALLFWNEGRAVHRAKALEEGAGVVVTVDAAAVSPGNEGRLVHFTGDAVGGTLADDAFGVTRDGVHLKRVVEMYQWDEDKKTERRKDGVGGGETTRTTYSYKTTWSEKHLKHADFKGPGRTDGKHNNPPAMPFTTKTTTAAKVTVGAFTLPEGLVKEFDAYQPVPADDAMVENLPAEWRSVARTGGDSLYLPYRPTGSVDPSSPKVGDLRVTYKLVPNGPVSVVARQAGATLAPYQAKTDTLFILYPGTRTAAEVFQAEHEKNTILTWVLRVVGFIVMWIGLALVLNPLKVLADVIGIVGDLVGAGIALASGVVAVTLSLLTIGAAWLVYRPVLGLGLLALAGGGVMAFLMLRKRGHAAHVARLAQRAMPPGYPMTGGYAAAPLGYPAPAYAAAPGFAAAPGAMPPPPAGGWPPMPQGGYAGAPGPSAGASGGSVPPLPPLPPLPRG